MLARTPKTDLEIIPLEPWRIRLRSALGRWELKHSAPKPGPKTRKMNKDRKRAIRDKIVVIMRSVEPTPFAAEGPCRYGIRSSLCLQGWKWADADAIAQEIVAAALNIAGAKRPAWKEGQPEWTQDGALPILRERCIRCRKPLPEGHYKFCSRVCSNGYHADRGNAHAAAERLAADEARLAAWRRKK